MKRHLTPFNFTMKKSNVTPKIHEYLNPWHGRYTVPQFSFDIFEYRLITSGIEYDHQLVLDPNLYANTCTSKFTAKALEVILGLLRHGDTGLDFYPNEILPDVDDLSFFRNHKLIFCFKSKATLRLFKGEIERLIDHDWFAPRRSEIEFMSRVYIERLNIIAADRLLIYATPLSVKQRDALQVVLDAPNQYIIDLCLDDDFYII
jgi:hypothetical protein